MKIVEAECVINSLRIMEVTVKRVFPEAGTSAEAVYALGQGDVKTKQLLYTHGRCTAVTANWSKRTLELLTDLLDSMEEDLIPRHFNTTTNMETTDAGKTGTENRRPEEVDQI